MVKKGMGVLRHYGIHGNFEVEEIISSQFDEIYLPLTELFPEFRQVPDAPDHENHIIWKGTLVTLPSNRQISEMILKASGSSRTRLWILLTR